MIESRDLPANSASDVGGQHLGSTTALVALTFSDDSSGRIGCSDSM